MAQRIQYKTLDGKRVPSVTTILGRFKESGGLLYWANSQGLEGKNLNEARQVAATAGTIAHDYVEAHIWSKGRPHHDAAPETLAMAESAYQTYLKWQASYDLEIKYTEVGLVSEQYRFGGRLDAMGIDKDGNLVLIDWKTSNSVYADYTMQMAAYAILWEEKYPENQITGGFHLCRFAKEMGDFAHHYYATLEKEKQAFLLMRELYDMIKPIEKRVK